MSIIDDIAVNFGIERNDIEIENIGYVSNPEKICSIVNKKTQEKRKFLFKNDGKIVEEV